MLSKNSQKSQIFALDYISSFELTQKITLSKHKLQEDKEIDDISLNEKLTDEYKQTYFNVKGKLLDIHFIEIQASPLRFNGTMLLKENEGIHTISMKRLKAATHQALMLVQYNTLCYLTNLLTEIIQSQADPLESQAVFTITPLTQIFYKSIKSFTPKVIKSRTELLQFPLPFLTTKKRGKPISQPLKQLSIEQLIVIQDIKELSYTELLSCPIETLVHKVRDIKHISYNAICTKIENLMGRVMSISTHKNRNGQYCLELMSLIDSNTIIVYLGKSYPPFLHPGIIIQISNINRKLTEKLAFIFYTNKSTLFRLIRDSPFVEMPKKELTSESLHLLKSLSFLIASKAIIRHHIHFIAKIKMIYRISGSLRKRTVSFDKDIFQTISLKGKVMLEDGSVEAMCYIDDEVLVSTLGISVDLLHTMAKIIQSKDYVVLYSKYDICNSITLDQIDLELLNERFFIGTPFCSLNPSQHSPIERCLSLGNHVDDIEHLKSSSCFVNGMLYYSYNYCRKRIIGVRPSLSIAYSRRLIENYDI